jgi:RNA polymerase sigma factor for flagellar operon FliA
MSVPSLMKEAMGLGQAAKNGLSPSERERHIQEFLPFIKYQVLRLVGRIPPGVEISDLTHAAIVGLLDALDKFDPAKGTQLRTYAEFRIRGAILDQLRSMDWATRTVRERLKRLEDAQVSLEKKLRRPPTEEELADYLGMNMDDYHQMILEAKGGSFVSLEELIQAEGKEGGVEAGNEYDPFEMCSLKEIRSRIRRALEGLDPKEQMVVHLYYFEELTMREIGMVMELSESRVCQLHARALCKLRSAMAP